MYEKKLSLKANIVIINNNKFVFCRMLNLWSVYILFCLILFNKYIFYKRTHTQFDSL